MEFRLGKGGLEGVEGKDCEGEGFDRVLMPQILRLGSILLMGTAVVISGAVGLPLLVVMLPTGTAMEG